MGNAPHAGPAGDKAGSPGHRRGLVASAVAVGAAGLSALCCIGPGAFLALGVGAGVASRVTAFEPVFTVLAIVLLAAAFYAASGNTGAAPTSHAMTAETPDTAAGTAVDPAPQATGCPAPRRVLRRRALLWIAAVLVLLLLTFRWWGALVA